MLPDCKGSVVLVRGGALGDFVLTLPLAQSLRDLRPAARLVLVGDPTTTRLAGEAQRIDATGADWARMFTPAGPSVSLREIFADCQLLVASVPRGTQASEVYLRNLRSLCGNLRIGDPLPETGQTRHMVERLLDPLRKDCVLPSCLRPSIQLPSVPPREHLIVLHPGSGGRSKCWPPAQFAALLTYLHDRGQRTEILWGPAEEARRHEFPPSLSDSAVLRAPFTPWALAHYLASARLYIGNDTGPGHVAAAVGCPTISLFGPTDPKLWRPLGPSGHVVQAPDGDLASLSLSQVIDAVDIALG